MIRKIVKLILTILISITLLPICSDFSYVYADDNYYPMSCSINEFEVSYIEDNGKLSKVSCHSTLKQAKAKMKENEDYVVRYALSYSPSKIVAMNSGLVYSYPGRGNSSTMTLFQNPKQRDSSLYKTTYISNHYEMTYVDTCGADIYDISTNGKGYVQIVMNGFEGFADIEYTDLVPSKYINNSIAIWLGGRNTYENENPFLVKVHQNYYSIEDNGKYKDLVFHYYRAYGTNGKDCLSYDVHVDNAANYLDAGMKKGVKYYSNDGIIFYSDNKLQNKVCRCYNYYQFLPVRSKTNITAKQFNNFMNKTKGSASVMYNKADAFINAQNTYGCNALIIYAMACLESAYGTSGYATNRNNLFGWSAYDDSPNDASYFSSVEVCVNEQMGRNLNWFMDYTNRRYFGTCVGNKGAGFNVYYASDPYWGAKIASIAYQIDKYANGSNGQLSDHNYYSLGFVKDNYNDVLYNSNISWDPNIYKTADSNSVLYTGRYGSHYQKDLTVIVLAETNNRYKIQSTNAVTNGKINTDDGLIKYDFDKSVGYINKKDVELLNGLHNVTEEDDTRVSTYEPIVSLRDIQLNDSKLTMNGVGLIQGIDFVNLENIAHYVDVYDLKDDSLKYSFLADTIDSDGYNLYDNFDYKYAGFNLEIILPNDNLSKGSYYFKLRTIINDREASNVLFTPIATYRNLVSKNNTFTYHIKMNEYANYRFELDVISSPNELDFTKINKPSKRISLATLDGFELADGELTINAHAYIHYLNYDNLNNLSYDVYLLDSNSNYLKLNTTIKSDGVDYTKLLDSNYKLDNIAFEASTKGLDKDVFDLNGDYIIYLVIKNGEYVDICEFINYGYKFAPIRKDDKEATLYTSKVRNRIMLKVN